MYTHKIDLLSSKIQPHQHSRLANYINAEISGCFIFFATLEPALVAKKWQSVTALWN